MDASLLSGSIPRPEGKYVSFLYPKLIIGSQVLGSPGGPSRSGPRVGADRVRCQESGNTVGFIRAQRGRARFFGEYYFIQHRQLFNLAQDISLAVNIFGNYDASVRI